MLRVILVVQSLIAVNHLTVITTIVQQFLKCEFHANCTEKVLFVVYSVVYNVYHIMYIMLLFIFINCNNVQEILPG